MSAQLPQRPNLEHLKSQAKELLSDYRNGVNVDRIHRVFPDKSIPTLSDAQLVLAREYGFESWPKLRAHVLLMERQSALIEQSDEMIRQLLTDSFQTAVSGLNENPGLAAASLAAACVTGNSAVVGTLLAKNPSLVAEATGPRDWTPLLYVCYSRLLRRPEYVQSLIDTAKRLLAAGADSNADWKTDGYSATCLYGATGVNNCPELAEVLLDAGANPNDDECLYHAMELPTPDCLKVLLTHGGDVGKVRNAFARLFDFERPDFLTVVLEQCEDVKTLPVIIPHALRRGRSASMIRILIESGADISSPATGGLTPFQAAIRMGHKDVASLLEQNGADLTLPAADQLIQKLIAGEKVSREEVDPEAIRQLDSERAPQVCIWAANGYDGPLRALLELGANVNAQDENGWTPLIEASLRGGIRTVRMLLEFHADPTIIERAHNGHAIGFACHGSTQHGWIRPQDYVDVVETLLDNGGIMPTRVWGSPQVQDLLRSRGCPEGE